MASLTGTSAIYAQPQPFVHQPGPMDPGFSQPMLPPSAPTANEMGKPPIVEMGKPPIEEKKPFVSDVQPPSYDEAVNL